MQTVRAADTNEVVKLIFRESDNDRKVMLQLEKKLFDYFNQDVFRDNNGTASTAEYFKWPVAKLSTCLPFRLEQGFMKKAEKWLRESLDFCYALDSFSLEE
uniref:Uncharacterized protein n=1 Tax=Sphaerodactylus townsendi TaxID=933632 RepID=A0ACB8F9E1_9SAUR